MLNDEIEVIEEAKEIEKLGDFNINETTKTLDYANIFLKYGVKINEIIDIVNKLNTEEGQK